MNHIGIPGIGGSLGQCQVCGQNFLMEILLGKEVTSLEMSNFPDQILYVHTNCRSLLVDGMNPEALPEGPIRKVLMGK